MTPQGKPKPPRWAALAFFAVAGAALIAQLLTGDARGADAWPGAPFAAHAALAAAVLALIWALAALARAALARREDHYLEDVEDGDLS